MARSTPNNTAHHKKAFLAAYAETGNVSAALRASKVGRTTHYQWVKTDPDYKAAVDAAEEEAGDALEAEARRRAFAGSDTLLIFMLKGAKPSKYREKFEHSGPNGGPMQSVVKHEFSDTRFAELFLARTGRGSAGAIASAADRN